MLDNYLHTTCIAWCQGVGRHGCHHHAPQQSAKLTNSEILRMGGSEMMEAGAAIPSISISKLLKTSDLMPVPYVGVLNKNVTLMAGWCDTPVLCIHFVIVDC